MTTTEIVKMQEGPLALDLAIVDGLLTLTAKLSPKQVLDLLAAKIGGPIPAEVAQFVENAFGLK